MPLFDLSYHQFDFVVVRRVVTNMHYPLNVLLLLQYAALCQLHEHSFHQKGRLHRPQ